MLKIIRYKSIENWDILKKTNFSVMFNDCISLSDSTIKLLQNRIIMKKSIYKFKNILNLIYLGEPGFNGSSNILEMNLLQIIKIIEI